MLQGSGKMHQLCFSIFPLQLLCTFRCNVLFYNSLKIVIYKNKIELYNFTMLDVIKCKKKSVPCKLKRPLHLTLLLVLGGLITKNGRGWFPISIGVANFWFPLMIGSLKVNCSKVNCSKVICLKVNCLKVPCSKSTV